MSLSREGMLQAIRAANARGGAVAAADVDAAWEALPRAYTRGTTRGTEEVLELLEDRLRDYDATVVRALAAEVSSVVGGLLAARGKTRLLAAPGMDRVQLPEGFEFVEDDGFSAPAIDRFEGVVTESTLAIAETGTIVLQTVAGQGRRVLSLVPDYHLCVVKASDVVATVPEAMDRIAARKSFATTFISGPSATADIEMTRIKGVHGPRFLDVIVVVDR
ncbi:L-lactate dehydrogenase complex protein LldG [Granulicella pectinivorans]|uniref:L-lactate dehydrogenase complex protein LldG n=1 Tax=Granulicella pectinivorans TaxID=474950 RepID=A0A1I6M2R6_9BACT|nr:LUD domain-containing protein [Granulicella pectinivorans]SFS09971.1 L-lactate dehydrogenase complex protein LldG [Granulicella pectinivorans]